MPRKDFVADLERLSRPGAAGNHITGLRRGEDDGTFTFVFDAKRPGVQSVEVAGTVPDIFEYPSSHQLMIYTTSADAPTYAARALDGLYLDTLNLQQAIKKISGQLEKALASDSRGDGDDQAGQAGQYGCPVASGRSQPDAAYDDNDDGDGGDDGDDDDDDDDGGSVGGWSDDDEPLDVDADGQIVEGPGATGPERTAKRAALTKELRNDLRHARAAGFKVGVLGDWRGGVNFYVTLGVRIAKLGISEEAMNAWKLDRTKYFILLIHYSNYYQALDRLTGEIGGYHAKKGVDLCVGTAEHYKPTLQEAINSFSTVKAAPAVNQGEHVIGTADGVETETDSEKKDGTFSGIFISGPLNELLNSMALSILKYRINYGFPWEGAELYYRSNQGGKESAMMGMEDKYYEVYPPKNLLSPIAAADALSANTAGPLSFPLLAMQFALRHLVRCTEFCLVCHSRVSTDFEALKPYVCSNPLCLYQYMSLGFGPSIEHEIISQPTVVDLLVSFCYVSAKAGKLKDFPVGMDLKVPAPTSKEWNATYYGFKGEFVFEDADNDTRPPLKKGDWIAFAIAGTSTEQLHARITETCFYPTVKVALGFSPKPPGHGGGGGDSSSSSSSSSTTTTTTATTATATTTTATTTTTTTATINAASISPLPPGKQTPDAPTSLFLPGVQETREVKFQIYDTNFDELADDQKRLAIANTLNTLPSVAEMKEWLQKNTSVGDEASLKKWRNTISPSALGVLRWIIASNRSCIVPLDENEESCESGFRPVQGMNQWKQFRFAMGAPDKEQRFVNSVKLAQAKYSLQYPTLFAFHGSPTANWHSIIREGLHFKEQAHGRAYGHGCYHSLDLNTSIGYSGLHPTNQWWPQSELKITSALSLNEIVNSPSEFVSKCPHIVVAQLDWIQTRYLFVKSAHLGLQERREDAVLQTTAAARPKKDQEHQTIHPQDPNYTPRNGAIKLVIPSSPLSEQKNIPADLDVEMTDAPPTPREMESSRKKRKKDTFLANKLFSIVGKAERSRLDDSESVETDPEDLMALLSEDEEDLCSREKGKGKAAVPTQPARVDEFQPGALDIADIQILAPPSYASPMASKRLNSDLQSIIKLQETTPPGELGFYIDPDMVENVYQWIVELHSFPEHLKLVQDMRSKTPILRSVVLEVRFGPQYPMSPPFVRVVKPRFLGYHRGGGGNVTLGGAMCMELLTNTGWSAVSTVESVLMQVRLAMMDEERAARLDSGPVRCYGVSEAVDAFKRACRTHGWTVPEGMDAFLRTE